MVLRIFSFFSFFFFLFSYLERYVVLDNKLGSYTLVALKGYFDLQVGVTRFSDVTSRR